MTNVSETPIAQCFYGMHKRCSNENNGDYALYGGRGIRVCERWTGRDGLTNFIADMGPRPEGKTLERRNTNGNYEPDNCRWATMAEQSQNRRNNKVTVGIAHEILGRLEHGEDGQSIARRFGISKVLVSQIKRGMKWRNVERFAGVDPNVMIAYRHNAHRRL